MTELRVTFMLCQGDVDPDFAKGGIHIDAGFLLCTAERGCSFVEALRELWERYDRRHISVRKGAKL